MASWTWSVDILAALGKRAGLTASEICDEVGLNRASAYRVLDKLESEGWILGDGRPKRYSLGVRVAEVAMPVLQQLPGRATLLPFLSELTETLNMSAQLIFYVKGGRVFSSDRADIISGRVIVQPQCGTARATLVSSGRVLLAWQSPEEIEAVTALGLPPLTPHTLTTPEALREAVCEARRCGYSRADREMDEHHSGLAVPVFDGGGNAVASFGVAMLGPWNQDEADRLLPAIRQVAARASAALGAGRNTPVII